MSNNIDWSKAPEGATHYSSERIWPWLRDGDMPAYFDGDKWVNYNNEATGREHIEESVRIPANIEWNGTGLPPVGTVCEVDYCEQWHQCEVIAHFQQRVGMVAAFTVDMGDGAKALDAFGAEYFRPIRTHEQIAAEERDMAYRGMIDDLASVMGISNIDQRECDVLHALVGAGYRKIKN